MSGMAFVFPGQGAQAVGMGQALCQEADVARQTFTEADAALGFPLSDLCFGGPEEELKRTENAQPAILAASIAAYRALTARTGAQPAFVAGHSLGEYAALVAAGVMNFVDALRLVRERGRLMAAAQPAGAGAMTAVLGLDAEALAKVLSACAAVGVAEIANLNAPGQIVISGETAAVQAAGAAAQAAGATKVVPLQVSGAFHSSLMRSAAEQFAGVLAGVELKPAAAPVVANVTAAQVSAPDAIRSLLVKQIYSPVRWEESVRYIAAAGVDTFVELGPGRVLSGLIKRIDRGLRIANVADGSSLKETLAILGEV